MQQFNTGNIFNLNENDRTSASKIFLSIIIVSYNCKSYLKSCLDSIISYKPGTVSFEIIIVDNNSTDGSARMIEEEFLKYPFLKLIKNKENKGFSYANNIAIKNSYSDYLLLLNSDTQVSEGSIEKLLKFFDDRKKDGELVGAAGPKIINSDGSIQLSCRRFPSLFSAGIYTILSKIKPDNRFSKNYKLENSDRSRPFTVDWVSGSAVMISRDAINHCGYFDERFFMYVEDVDLCYRFWQKGFKVYYCPYSEVLHHIGKSIQDKPLRSQIMMQKSALIFFIKRYRKGPGILLIPLVLAVLGFRIIVTWLQNIRK